MNAFKPTHQLPSHLWPVQCSVVPSMLCRRSADRAVPATSLSWRLVDTRHSAGTEVPESQTRHQIQHTELITRKVLGPFEVLRILRQIKCCKCKFYSAERLFLHIQGTCDCEPMPLAEIHILITFLIQDCNCYLNWGGYVTAGHYLSICEKVNQMFKNVKFSLNIGPGNRWLNDSSGTLDCPKIESQEPLVIKQPCITTA